jgi:hypothetical protein
MRPGDKTLARRIPLWFGAALIAFLTTLTIGLVHWYSGRSNDLNKRLENAMEDFGDGVHHAIDGKLDFFENADKSDIATLLGASPEKDVYAQGGSITTGATWGSSSIIPCRLQLGRAETQAILSYDYSGLSRNGTEEFERTRVTLTAKLNGDFDRLSTTTGLDAIFVADRQGVVLGKYGRPETLLHVPDLENIKSYRNTQAKTIRMGEEDYVTFSRNISFRDSDSKIAEQCIDKISLQALGVIRKSQVTQQVFQLPQVPVFILCFMLLIGLLSFPFLQLFAPRPAEPFSRMDGLLLLVCGTALVALLVTGFLFLTSFSALQNKEEQSLDTIAGGLENLGNLGKLKGKVPDTSSTPTMADLAPLQEESTNLPLRGFWYAIEKRAASGDDENSDEAGLRRAIADADPAQHDVFGFAGRFYRFHAVQIGGDRRILVARDQEPLRSVRIQVAMFCLVLFILYVIVTAASLAIYLSNFSINYPFFWPLPELGGAYAVLTAGYLVLLILSCALSLCLAPQWRIFIGFLSPLIVLITTITGLVRWRSPRGALSARGRKNERWLATIAAVAAILLALLFHSADRLTSFLAAALPIVVWATFQFASRWSRNLGRKWGTPLYAVAVIALMMVIGGLPAFCYYEAVFGQEMGLLAKWAAAQPEKASSGKEKPKKAEAQSIPVHLKEWRTGVLGGFGAQAFNRAYEQLRPSLNHNRYVQATNDILLEKLPATTDTKRPVDKTFGLTPVSAWVSLALVAAFAITTWLLVASVRRLFGPGFSRQGPRPESLLGRQILWIGPYGDWIERLKISNVLPVALNQIADLNQGGENHQTLLIPDFGARWLDDSTSQTRYEALKKLIGEWQGGIWLVSEVAPEEFALPTGVTAAPSGTPHELVAALQDEFTIIHGRDDRKDIKKIARIEPEVIWRSLPREERLTLLQVATSGYFAQGEHAQSLVTYGVLSANPAPQIATLELRRLVLARRGEVKEENSGTTTSSPLLSRLRPVLAVGLFGVLAFLSLTQADWFLVLSGVIAGIALALGSVSQIGTWLRSSGSEDVH